MNIFKYLWSTQTNNTNIPILVDQDNITQYNHLLFHIHCIEHEKTYYSIEQIHKYINIFDGYKIITVSGEIDPICTSAAFMKLVATLSQTPDIFIIPTQNNLDRRESVHFFNIAAPLLKALLSSNNKYTSANNYVFYAHSKGVTHTEKNYAITAWVNTLWKYNLAYYNDTIKPLLGKHKFIGCLKTKEQHAIKCSCHYQGTFFWFDAKVLSDQSWYQNYNHILSLEMWPGLVANDDECFSVFDLPEGDLYRKDYWYNQYFVGRIDKPHTVSYYRT
jgi:hypothetical protein